MALTLLLVLHGLAYYILRSSMDEFFSFIQLYKTVIMISPCWVVVWVSLCRLIIYIWCVSLHSSQYSHFVFDRRKFPWTRRVRFNCDNNMHREINFLDLYLLFQDQTVSVWSNMGGGAISLVLTQPRLDYSFKMSRAWWALPAQYLVICVNIWAVHLQLWK